MVVCAVIGCLLSSCVKINIFSGLSTAGVVVL